MSSCVNRRLAACATLIRQGAVLGDIGTDHGYLPISLLINGKISRAVLSDINEGPLNKARENVAAAGVGDLAELVLCDGAASLCGRGITDYCIAGMGGELIARIISDAPHISDGAIRLVLQPMSRPEALRAYLWDNGFVIEREIYVSDEGKHYVCLMATYAGGRTDYSVSDIYFGKEESIFDQSEPYVLYMKERERALERAVRGRLLGNSDSSLQQALLAEIRKRLEKIDRKA